MTRIVSLVIALCGVLLAQQQNGWHYTGENPQTKKLVLTIDASAVEFTKDERALLQDVTAHVYQEDGVNFREVKSDRAVLDPKLGTLSYGPRLSKVIKLKGLR